MSSQLTMFEQYVESVFGTDDVTYINDDKALSNLSFMQENYSNEHQEIIDQVAISYEPPPGMENDLDELMHAITKRNGMKFVAEIEILMITEFKVLIDNVQEEIAYKKQDQAVDGSYQAKQYAEIQRMG